MNLNMNGCWINALRIYIQRRMLMMVRRGKFLGWTKFKLEKKDKEKRKQYGLILERYAPR